MRGSQRQQQSFLRPPRHLAGEARQERSACHTLVSELGHLSRLQVRHCRLQLPHTLAGLRPLMGGTPPPRGSGSALGPGSQDLWHPVHTALRQKMETELCSLGSNPAPREGRCWVRGLGVVPPLLGVRAVYEPSVSRLPPGSLGGAHPITLRAENRSCEVLGSPLVSCLRPQEKGGLVGSWLLAHRVSPALRTHLPTPSIWPVSVHIAGHAGGSRKTRLSCGSRWWEGKGTGKGTGTGREGDLD